MSVFIFEKSLLERLDESANVLKCKSTAVPASEVHTEWACHLELQIEPAGKITVYLSIYLYIYLYVYVMQVGRHYGKYLVPSVRCITSSIQR